LSKALQDDLSRALGHHRDKKGRHYVGVVEAESEQEHGANEEDI
jgi:hypothetical protein